MAKGRKTGGRQKGGLNLVPAELRESLRTFVETQRPKLDGWIANVAKDNPARAVELVISLAALVLPRQTEVAGPGGGNITVRIGSFNPNKE